MQHPLTAPPVPERVRTLAATAAPTHAAVAGGLPASAARGGVDAQGRPVPLVKPGEALYGTAAEAVVTVDLDAPRPVPACGRADGASDERGGGPDTPDEEE
jgi:hypothetical protein